VLRLRTAIERDQLTLEYQPKADMRSGRIVGAEALARWDAPRRGRIMPSEFIPAAERIPGSIKLLTEWSLGCAMRQAAEWHADGHDLTIAVNLSPRMLVDDALCDTIASLLDEWGVAPDRIQLELTETALIDVTEPARVNETMQELSRMGLLIALDDFGTGYSSLTQLRDLPIDKVKIDKSFVSQMDEQANDALIVRGVIALAKSLGLRVVAEGVETEPVWRLLSDLGCDVAQGNYLSPPLPPEDMIAWVRQWEELYEEAHRMAQELLERRYGPDNRRSGIDDRRSDRRNGRFSAVSPSVEKS
jgi:EAL domain-containing protein (putative c-di-GMP-specific phosphodiesterase class I)